MSENLKKKIRLFFTGLTMGMADLVPGVSGGTIAFVFGIYDELLYTIKILTGQVPKLVLKARFKQAFKLIPFGFIIPLGIGIVAVIFGMVQVVSYLLDNQPVMVWAFFFGLVLGSVVVISKRIKKWNTNRFTLLILGFVLTFIVVGLPALGGNDSPVALFLTGAVAITAMILPGISGSLIMVLLGQYEIVINSVAERDFLNIVVFAAGAILGLALFVRLLSWLLKHYYFAVIAFLIGVMAGSLRRIWPWQNASAGNILPEINLSLVFTILLMLAGFALVLVLERIGIAREHDDVESQEFKKDYLEPQKED